MTALSEKAVLVRVIGCTWSGRRTDKVVAEGAAKHFDTTSNWVSGSKRLVDPAVIAEPKKILGAARNYLRGDSVGPLDGEFITGGLPSWDDKGWYILPNALNEKVLRNLGEFRSQFEAALEDLRDALPAAIKRARDENPKLWSADDYAGGRDDEANAAIIVAERYDFDRELDVIPDSGDIRVSASKEFVDALKAEVEGRANKRLEEVATHTRDTVLSTLRHFADSLSEYDPENKRATVFRNSTVTRLRELVPVVRALNIEGDARLDKAADDILAVLGNRTAETLREDHEDRAIVASKARDVAKNLTDVFS